MHSNNFFSSSELDRKGRQTTCEADVLMRPRRPAPTFGFSFSGRKRKAKATALSGRCSVGPSLRSLLGFLSIRSLRHV